MGEEIIGGAPPLQAPCVIHNTTKNMYLQRCLKVKMKKYHHGAI